MLVHFAASEKTCGRCGPYWAFRCIGTSGRFSFLFRNLEDPLSVAISGREGRGFNMVDLPPSFPLSLVTKVSSRCIKVRTTECFCSRWWFDTEWHEILVRVGRFSGNCCPRFITSRWMQAGTCSPLQIEIQRGHK